MAFDDSPHNREDLKNNRNSSTKDTQVDLIGVVFRGHQLLHVSQSKITVDGTDSTEAILQQVNLNPHRRELRLILVDSPTLAGFNVVNYQLLWEELKLPIVLMPEEKPRERMVKVFSKVFPQRAKQIARLEKLSELESMEVRINNTPEIAKKIYFHPVGIETRHLREIFHYLTNVSSVPEPLRVAHIIASRSRYPPKSL